jgi:hypothetical protein
MEKPLRKTSRFHVENNGRAAIMNSKSCLVSASFGYEINSKRGKQTLFAIKYGFIDYGIVAGANV